MFIAIKPHGFISCAQTPQGTFKKENIPTGGLCSSSYLCRSWYCRFRNTSVDTHTRTHTSFSFMQVPLSSTLFFQRGSGTPVALQLHLGLSSPVLKGQIKPYYIFEGGLHSGCHADAQMKRGTVTQSLGLLQYEWTASVGKSRLLNQVAPKGFFFTGGWIYKSPH